MILVVLWVIGVVYFNTMPVDIAFTNCTVPVLVWNLYSCVSLQK